MNRQQRAFEESFRAYTSAKRPTSQLTANLSAAFAQMMADDTEAPASVGLMGFQIVREPSLKRTALTA
jgi:hypothetical protein